MHNGAFAGRDEAVNVFVGGDFLVRQSAAEAEGKEYFRLGALEVSPDGKALLAANTLSQTVSVIDAKTHKYIKDLPCNAGCHGGNFGAKGEGGKLTADDIDDLANERAFRDLVAPLRARAMGKMAPRAFSRMCF